MPSAKRKKQFVFVCRETGRVLAQKTALDFDFTIESSKFECIQVVGGGKIEAVHDFSQTYSSAGGLRSIAVPDRPLREKLGLERRKIEVLLLVKASLALIVRDIQESFSDATLSQAPVSPENFKRYWTFARGEADILLAMVENFFQDFQSRLESCHDLRDVDREYDWLVKNVNLGVYSATNRERKGIGFGQQK